MKTTWCLLLATALSLVMPQVAGASGACTAARFHDWQDKGCNANYPGAGGPAAPKSCNDCGMPRWWVNEPYISLHMSDTPLSYKTSSGQDMDFQWFYRQRAGLPGGDEMPSYAQCFKADGYQSMTNCGSDAYWGHSWNQSVVLWDVNWLNAWHPVDDKTNTTYYPPGFGIFSLGSYEAYVFQPAGGIQYFNIKQADSNSRRDPQSQVTLQSLSGYPVLTNSPTADANNTNIFWGDDNSGIGVKLVYPDGSKDVFGLIVSGTTGTATTIYGWPDNQPSPVKSFARAMLTKRVDAQGRVTALGYEKVRTTPAGYYNYRLKYVVDADTRTNQFFYTTTNGFAVAEIDDPYGRKTLLGYDGTSRLTNIVDAAGLTNSLKYPAAQVTMTMNTYVDANSNVISVISWKTNATGWPTNLSTPYGNTAFTYYEMNDASVSNGVQQRAIYVSEPTGAQQLYYYLHRGIATNGNALLATAAQAPTVPNQLFDDGNSSGGIHPTLEYRNSIYWGRRQFAALSTNVQNALPANLSNALASLTMSDFRKGRVRNWLWQTNGVSISEALGSERDPSPDAAGQIEGARRWYGYPGKTAPELAGTSPQISCLAQLLPDGSTNYTTYNYYPSGSAGAGLVSDSRSTYTKPDGASGLLTNWFRYAVNSVDLAGISNSAGQYVNYGYNNYHQITKITNALNQVTALSWDEGVSWNLLGVQWPSGQSVNLTYGGADHGRLQTISWSPSGRAFTINSYSAGNPASVTDDRNLTVNHSWDGLNRLTGTVFPDNTSISNVYSRLDLVATKDRLTNWTYYAYDGLQHLTSVTNANNAVTTYSWCGCGSLNFILDAITNLTTLNYDNQGNLTSIGFPDYSSLTYKFDLAGRMTNVVDGANHWLAVRHNVQGLATNVANANGTLHSASFDAVNRPISVTDANGVTVTNTFDALNELIQRAWITGSGAIAASESFGYSAKGLIASTNRDGKTTFYNRDNAGRTLGVTNANLETTRFAYDSLNNVTDLWDGNANRTRWQYNEYGWLTNKLDGLNRNAFRYAYNPNGWVTNRWTPEKGNTGYAYDNVGNLKSVVYPQQTISYAFDALNRLTNMVDAVGTTAFSYTPAGRLQSENGPWASDTVAYAYVQGLRTNLSITQPGGTWSQGYGFDSGGRMTSLTSPAGSFNYSYNFKPASSLVTGIGLPNGANIVNGYDNLARLRQTSLNNYWGHPLDSYTYAPDALGLRTNIVRNLGLTTNSVSVGFDNIGQLTSWSASELGGLLRQNEQLGFGYDAANNLHTRNNGNLAQTFTTDAANQLNNVARTGTFTESGATPAPATSVMVNGQAAQFYGDFTFARTNLPLPSGVNSFTNIAQNTYGLKVTNVVTLNLPSSVNLGFDNNGNLTNDGTRTFGFDAENQLTNVTVASRFKKDFVYDGFNRLRIKREFGWIANAWTQTNEVHFIWDGNAIVQHRDSNNVPTLTLTRGLDLSGSLQGAGGIGGLLAMTEGSGANTYYHSDGSGNVTALMDASENIVGRREMDAFGRTINLTGSKAGMNPFWHASQLYDADLDIYSYWHRTYSPSLQRWLNPDPIGERGGINLYQFNRNDPIDYIDPTGRAPQLTTLSQNSSGQISAGYTPYQFGQGYGIGLNSPPSDPIGEMNADLNKAWNAGFDQITPPIDPNQNPYAYAASQTAREVSLAALLAIATDRIGAPKSQCPKLSNTEVRSWYNSKVKGIDTSGPLTRETAERVNAERNALKQQARDMMADREAAEQLAIDQPLRSLDYYIDKYSKQGHSGEDLWQQIINAGTRPNATVNAKFGIK